MHPPIQPGQIIVLNGAPRAGKSSIAAAIQASFAGVWMNLGVDGFMRMTPAHLQPGIGLRPGGERPDLEPVVALLYRALYDAIAAHSRLGINVVTDVGHHDAYSQSLGIFAACARRLAGLPVLVVGVRCPLEVVMQRRRATGWHAELAPDAPPPPPVQAWQYAVHDPGLYDVEVDTAQLTPQACADIIRRLLTEGPPPTACGRLAALPPPPGTAW